MAPTEGSSEEEQRPLRADARRNRERILAAATELFVEQGVEVPLDTIAKRADVGIATLYRRFPDRQALAAAVALEAFTSVRTLAQDSVAAHLGPGGLRSFLLGVAELRIGVLMASLLPALAELPPDEGLTRAFHEMLDAVAVVGERAHATGELRDDATVDDVMLLLAMLTRPLEGVPADYSQAVTPRLLHLVLEGLQPGPGGTPLPPAPPRLDPEDHVAPPHTG